MIKDEKFPQAFAGTNDKTQRSRGINPPAESESTLKRTVAGFSLLWLSASEFIPRLSCSPGFSLL